MRDHDISQRRACRLVGVDPKTVRRERPPDNPDIRKEMRAVAAKRRRFGYRRIGLMLERGIDAPSQAGRIQGKIEESAQLGGAEGPILGAGQQTTEDDDPVGSHPYSVISVSRLAALHSKS